MARIVLHKELFDYDTELRKEYPVICGVDEAGRGPLAGMFTPPQLSSMILFL